MIELCCEYLSVAIDCMFLSCHVRVSSESTLYSCLNVKEKLLLENHRFRHFIEDV